MHLRQQWGDAAERTARIQLRRPHPASTHTAVSTPGASSPEVSSSAPAPAVPGSTTPLSATSTRSTTTPATTAPPPGTTVKPAVQETADRKAIEALWSQYIVVAGGLALIPTALARQAAISPYAVNPALQDVLDVQVTFVKNGWVSYGTVGHRTSWTTPVAGKDTAVMSDCGDYSKAGRMVAKTGKKLTVGVPRSNTQITVARQTDGSWKIQKILYLTTSC